MLRNLKIRSVGVMLIALVFPAALLVASPASAQELPPFEQRSTVTSAPLVDVTCGTAMDGTVILHVVTSSHDDGQYSVDLNYMNDTTHPKMVISAGIDSADGQVWSNYADDSDVAQEYDSGVLTVAFWGSGDFYRYQVDRTSCGERPNRVPSAGEVAGSVARYESSKSFALNGADLDGDPLSYSLTSQPTHGTAIVSGGEVVYQPDGTYTGTETFQYTASDGMATSAPASISLQVEDATLYEAPAPVFSPNGRDADGEPIYPVLQIPQDDKVCYDVSYQGTTTQCLSGPFNFDLHDGTVVATARTHSSDDSVFLTGQKEWTYTSYDPLYVEDAGNGLWNKIKVVNSDNFPVVFAWPGRSVTIPAASEKVVPLRDAEVNWQATTQDGTLFDSSTNVAAQMRASGRILFRCAGQRHTLRVPMENVGSSLSTMVKVRFGNRHDQIVLRPGQKRVVTHKGELRPGMLVTVYNTFEVLRDVESSFSVQRRVPGRCR